MSDTPSIPELTRALAELTVRFGANLQPGQIMAFGSEPGKEELTRAIADVAYANGARFVDLLVFDYHLKRSRALYADPDSSTSCRPGTESGCGRWGSCAARWFR